MPSAGCSVGTAMEQGLLDTAIYWMPNITTVHFLLAARVGMPRLIGALSLVGNDHLVAAPTPCKVRYPDHRPACFTAASPKYRPAAEWGATSTLVRRPALLVLSSKPCSLARATTSFITIKANISAVGKGTVPTGKAGWMGSGRHCMAGV